MNWLRDHETELLMLGCAAIFIAVMVFGGPAKAANPVPFQGPDALNRIRGCIFTSTQVAISTSTSSAASSQLAANSMYVMTCTDPTFVRFSSTSPTAVATDMPFPADMWIKVLTGTSNGRYVAGILASGTGTCNLILCE